MEITQITEKKTFDFKTNKVETMDLDTLMRTQKENNIEGEPQKGIYHFQLILRIVEICKKYNLNYEVEEIFAAHNDNRQNPGTSTIKSIAAVYGEGSVESHVLRRVFTTIRIKDFDTDELTTTLAVAFHQEGIQAAIGPCVRICHNQCILSPDRSVSNYGKDKVTTGQIFERVDEWLSEHETQMNEDRRRIHRLKNTPLTQKDVYAYIGLLTCIRASHDSKDKRLSSQVQTYPLNQTQINTFAEDVLQLMLEKKQLTAWDLYNVATELYKPTGAQIPTLIPQNLAFVGTLNDFCEIKETANQN